MTDAMVWWWERHLNSLLLMIYRVGDVLYNRNSIYISKKNRAAYIEEVVLKIEKFKQEWDSGVM